MIGFTDLCRKLLPSRLQSMTGSLDRHFIDACEQWKRRTPVIPPFDQRQKKWDWRMGLATCRCYLIVATEHSTKPGCHRTPIRGVSTTCWGFPTYHPYQRNRHAYGRQVPPHCHSYLSWCSSMRRTSVCMRCYGGHQRASRSQLQEVKGSHSKTHGSQWGDQASFALSRNSLTSETGQAVPLW